jgi:hypothetical protein
MNYEVVDILRTLSANFSSLADELEKEQAITNNRLCNVEIKTQQNRDTLMSVADAIYKNLN